MEFFAVVILSLSHISSASAQDFLQVPEPLQLSKHISGSGSHSSLLKEIEGLLPKPQGSGAHLTSTRISHIQDSLHPIYEALPKNEHGTIEHAVARYALHRFFVLKHGWVIRSLEPSIGAENAPSKNDQMAARIQDLFTQHIGDKGFNLQELATLAATLMHLIQEDTLQRFAAATAVHDLEHSSTTDHARAEQVLDTYMMSYILSENLANVSSDAAQSTISEMPERFAHWGETQTFVRAVKQSMLPTSSDKELGMVDDTVQVEVGALAKVAETVDEQFGEFLHSTVCKGLKTRLMGLEYQNTGRVKLSAFYKHALEGFWQFSESAAYLQGLGVLEMTDPNSPSVMIANYLAAPGNCLATSGMYSVCCRNECSGLLGHLEQQVAAPEASPEVIASLIENLPSDTVSAPRNLSSTLLRRLEEIAASHEGRVHLHGRLFSQWMHHAYPRECPYPHISGTTSPKLPEEWFEDSGKEYEASGEEMMQYIQSSRKDSMKGVAGEDLMTWSPEEELLVIRPSGESLPLPAKAPPATRSIVLFAAAGSLAYALVQTIKATSFASHTMPEKFAI